MKLNEVKVYQAGGGISYQPIPMVPQAQPQVAAPTAEDGKKEDSYLDKSILEKMLGQGITTDVMQYSEKLQSAYQEYNSMSEFQRQSYKGKQLRQMLKGDLGELNKLMRAKTTFDGAIANAKSNGALEELAVTNTGMVVKDMQGKINIISFAQYAADNNSENKKYFALTNGQLAEEREYNKQLIDNSAVYSVLNYGVGVDKVKDEIYKVLNKIGKTSKSVTNSIYERNDAEDVRQLIAAAKEGQFKMKSGESIETNTPQIEAAKQTMWLNLSENSKNVLRARAATTVTSPGDIENMAKTMAASLLDPAIETSSSKVYDESLRAGASGGAGGANKMANMGPTEMAFQGRTNITPISQIAGGLKIEGLAYAIPPQNYTDANNQRVTISNAGKLNQISYLSKAFVGNGDKVNPDNTVITGDAYYTTLPVTEDDNGNMKIDEAGSKNWAEYEKALSRIPVADRTELKMSELKHKFNAHNLKVRKLLVAEAASYADSFYDGRESKYYQDVDKSTEAKLAEIIDPNEKGPRSWLDNSVHKHLIFIPAKDEASSRFADGNSARVPDSVYDVRTFNTGANGANIQQGRQLGVDPVATGLTKHLFAN